MDSLISNKRPYNKHIFWKVLRCQSIYWRAVYTSWLCHHKNTQKKPSLHRTAKTSAHPNVSFTFIVILSHCHFFSFLSSKITEITAYDMNNKWVRYYRFLAAPEMSIRYRNRLKITISCFYSAITIKVTQLAKGEERWALYAG